MDIALTRTPTEMNHCELTFMEREEINYKELSRQHKNYQKTLKQNRCYVYNLAPLLEYPDSVFIEDNAVVFDEAAIITRPGAESRRLEVSDLIDVLRDLRENVFEITVGTLDGGDVLQIGSIFYVGLSSRTSFDGFMQFKYIVEKFGYSVFQIPINNCLHLKTAATKCYENTILYNPRWVFASNFLPSHNFISIDPSEPFAANVLHIGDRTIVSNSHPKTNETLMFYNIRPEYIDNSELEKAEGGLTCSSLIFR